MPDHTESFIRALVDEALNRTPPGGFPELEQRHGLRPGLLFDWVDRYGPARPPGPFEAMHFWIGTSTLDEEAFLAYFDSDPAYWDLDENETETAAEDVTGCGFSIDLGERFLYDEDLLQAMWRPHPVPVRDLVDESTLRSAESADLIVRACEERGIRHANAAFVYADPSQPIRDPRKIYNGLHYIGLFDN